MNKNLDKFFIYFYIINHLFYYIIYIVSTFSLYYIRIDLFVIYIDVILKITQAIQIITLKLLYSSFFIVFIIESNKL